MENGVTFLKAISSSDYTGPSLQAIYDARFPIGCGKNKEYFAKIYSKSISFLNTLKENGYHIVGLLDSCLADQGLHDAFENKDLPIETSFTIYNGFEEKILSKLDSLPHDESWFFHVHFMELHKPCKVPPDFANLKLSERYDKNASEIDSCIGKMLDKIKLENLLIILTADHGEYIHQYDDTVQSNPTIQKSKNMIKKFIPDSWKSTIHEHKRQLAFKIKNRKLETPHEKRATYNRPEKDRFLFDDVVHIPLIFSGYGIEKPIKYEVQVRHVDIFPTIFDIFGLQHNHKNIHGISLKPIFEGKILSAQPAYMESSVLKTITKDPNAVVGIRTNDYKYFRNVYNKNENVHLYDLKVDIHEDNNIAKDNPKVILQMEKLIDEIQKSAENEPEPEHLTKEEEKELEAELKKLGYL